MRHGRQRAPRRQRHQGAAIAVEVSPRGRRTRPSPAGYRRLGAPRQWTVRPFLPLINGGSHGGSTIELGGFIAPSTTWRAWA